MAIDTTGKWWVGSQAEDIKGFLEAYTAEEYTATEFRIAKCACGSVDFNLEADDEEGCAKRICAKCNAGYFICDSEEYWEDATPEKWECVECKSNATNIGVGFSLYDDNTAIRWLYVGSRCAKCGVLGCFAGWKVAYEPSLQLMDKV